MHFRPEFINRIDEFIVFQGLRREQIKSIVQLQARRVEKRLAEKKMRMELQESGEGSGGRVGYRGGAVVVVVQPGWSGGGRTGCHVQHAGPCVVGARPALRLSPCEPATEHACHPSFSRLCAPCCFAPSLAALPGPSCPPTLHAPLPNLQRWSTWRRAATTPPLAPAP